MLSARDISPLHSNARLTAHFSLQLLSPALQRDALTPPPLHKRYSCEAARSRVEELCQSTEEEGWTAAEEKVKKKSARFGSLGVLLGGAAGFECIVVKDNGAAECACACLYEPLYWNAGPGHSAAPSFNFCKQTNGRRLEDHTASLVKL